MDAANRLPGSQKRGDKDEANPAMEGCGLTTSLSLSAAAMPLTAHAQPTAWPAKPIRLVVGGPAGGNTDSLARLLADGMQNSWASR